MKKTLVIAICLALLTAAGCKKDPTPNTTTPYVVPPITTADTVVSEENVLRDFADVLANPNYKDIAAQALLLNQAVTALHASPTDANLATAQAAWRNTRTAWESCEGYLFGPVEDNNYDPSMDTWPLDKTQLDSLLASNNQLSVSDIDALSESLKGFHAIEYVIFGVGGKRTAAQIDARQMTYVVSLTQSLYNTTTTLRDSWDSTQGNYTAQVKKAGAGSATFSTKKDAFLAIVDAMGGICDEVGTGKMQEPLGANGHADSTLDESSFSHNSTTDFTNNIKGIRNAYYCTYGGIAGHSLHELVASKNKSLDNQITTAIDNAVGSFNTISSDYEVAIYNQRSQIIAIQAKIATLQELLDGQTGSLHEWVMQNIRD